VPEIATCATRPHAQRFGDFGNRFTMIGLGEPAGPRRVVGGSYFSVMGFAGAWPAPRANETAEGGGRAVLTYRFWTTTLGSDRSVIGKT